MLFCYVLLEFYTVLLIIELFLAFIPIKKKKTMCPFADVQLHLANQLGFNFFWDAWLKIVQNLTWSKEFFVYLVDRLYDQQDISVFKLAQHQESDFCKFSAFCAWYNLNFVDSHG